MRRLPRVLTYTIILASTISAVGWAQVVELPEGLNSDFNDLYRFVIEAQRKLANPDYQPGGAAASASASGGTASSDASTSSANPKKKCEDADINFLFNKYLPAIQDALEAAAAASEAGNVDGANERYDAALRLAAEFKLLLEEVAKAVKCPPAEEHCCELLALVAERLSWEMLIERFGKPKMKRIVKEARKKIKDDKAAKTTDKPVITPQVTDKPVGPPAPKGTDDSDKPNNLPIQAGTDESGSMMNMSVGPTDGAALGNLFLTPRFRDADGESGSVRGRPISDDFDNGPSPTAPPLNTPSMTTPTIKPVGSNAPPTTFRPPGAPVNPSSQAATPASSSPASGSTETSHIVAASPTNPDPYAPRMAPAAMKATMMSSYLSNSLDVSVALVTDPANPSFFEDAVATLFGGPDSGSHLLAFSPASAFVSNNIANGLLLPATLNAQSQSSANSTTSQSNTSTSTSSSSSSSGSSSEGAVKGGGGGGLGGGFGGGGGGP